MNSGRFLRQIMPPILSAAARRLRRFIRGHRVGRRLARDTKLHLACGSNILSDWANVDIEDKGPVIGWDVTDGLPVHSTSIDFIFCEHFIEHITLNQATRFLAECHRVLRPDGVLRLSTPNLKMLVDQYLLGRTMEWADVQWAPETACQMLNEAFRLWGHQFVYDRAELERLLHSVGFLNVTEASWRESQISALKGLECRPFHSEIILEARKT